MNDDNDDDGSSSNDSHGSEADDLLDPADQFTRLLGDLYGTADEFSRLLVDSFPAVEPDDLVWDGIEAQISAGRSRGSESAQSPLTADGAGTTERTLGSRLAPLLAVAAVLLALVGTAFVVQRTSNGDVASVSAGVVRQLSDPSTGDLSVTVVTTDDGLSVVTTAQLPALDPAETYQLWSVVGDEVVSVGLLGSNPSDVEFRIEGDPTVLALTVEVAGGVAVSEATPVAVWQSS